MKTNCTLAFCLGSVMAGEVKPYLVGAIAPNSCLCRSILISIANPRVFHLALHTGSGTRKEYGLHTFPRCILRQLEANASAKWLEPFPLPPLGRSDQHQHRGHFQEPLDPLRCPSRLHLQHLPSDTIKPARSLGLGLDPTCACGSTHRPSSLSPDNVRNIP